MLRKLVWVPVLAIALLPAVAHAQSEQGEWELTLSGSGVSDEDFDATTLGFAFGLGYYFSDQFEAGVRQTVNWFENGGSDFNGSTTVVADFHFDLDRWAPFIGAGLGYIYGDGTNDTWVAGPEGGVKYYVMEDTFIFGLVQYQFFFEDTDEVDDAFEDGQWVYTLGIGFQW